MPERKRGLGPLGPAAVQRASDEWANRAPVLPQITAEEPRGVAVTRNPASITATRPGEEETPADNWYVFPDSSRCVEASYNGQTGQLFVRFVKPTPFGTPWTYEGVPANVWRNFKRSSSPGTFVNRVLNQFDYHKGNWE